MILTVMTVAATSLVVEKYTGNDNARDFSFSFWAFTESNISVTQADKDGAESVLALNSDYSVSFNANHRGGIVRLASVLPSGCTLAITRSTPINQEMDLINQGAFYAEDHETAFDKLTAICQELKETLSRCLIVPITSEKTPLEVMTDLLEVASKAQEYADRAEQIYNEVKNTELYVSSTWADIQNTKNSIDISKAAIDAMLSRAEEILARNEVIGKHVDALYPHIDDLEAISGHVDEVHKVGQDLMTTESGTLDLGSITDSFVDTASTVEGGYIKKVAEHIDCCIHPVSEHLDEIVKAPEYAASASEDAATATKAAETAVKASEESEAILNRMIENETVDYVEVFEAALAGNTEAANDSDFVQIFESALN